MKDNLAAAFGRLSLLGIAIATAASSVGLAAPMVYETTRDTYLRFNESNNYGTHQTNRVGKWQQDAYIADFDRSQILSDIEAELGGPLTVAADLDAFRISWFVKSVPGTNFNTNAVYRPIVYQSRNQDWGETTANFYEADTGQPWHNSGGSNVADFFDGTRFPGNNVFEAWGTPEGEYREWVLDSEVVFSLLTDGDAVALLFQHDSVDNNGSSYSREAAVGNRPFLQVELLSAVPEPGSALLWLAMGAACCRLTRRRSRR